MSFTYEVKNEVSKLEVPKTENIAELSALLISTAEISDTIKITIENASVARKIFSSIKEIFDINVKITVRKGFNFQKKYLYILEITKKIPDILETLGIANSITSSYIYDDDETLRDAVVKFQGLCPAPKLAFRLAYSSNAHRVLLRCFALPGSFGFHEP